MKATLTGLGPVTGVFGVVIGGMDGEVGVAQLAPPVRLGIAVPFFGQGEPEHITVEARCPLRFAGDKDDSGDEPHIFRAL